MIKFTDFDCGGVGSFYKGSKSNNPGSRDKHWLPDDIWDLLPESSDCLGPYSKCDRWKKYKNREEAIFNLKKAMIRAAINGKYDFTILSKQGAFCSIDCLYHNSVRIKVSDYFGYIDVSINNITEINLILKTKENMDTIQVYNNGCICVNGIDIAINQEKANNIRVLAGIAPVDLMTDPITKDWLVKNGWMLKENRAYYKVGTNCYLMYICDGVFCCQSVDNWNSAPFLPFKFKTKGDWFELKKKFDIK